MPVYNGEKYLQYSLESVIAQTYKYWELIIIDDCSIDNSAEVATMYSKKYENIVVIRNEFNLGAGLSRNRGLEICSGDFITFLDCDDVYTRDRLSIHLEFMIRSKANISHTSYGYLSEDGRVVSGVLRVSNRKVGFRDLLRRTEMSCMTTMVSKKLKQHLVFPNLRVKQDYGLWLKLLKMGEVSLPLDVVTAYYRQRPNSNTNRKHKLVINHYLFLRNFVGLSSLKAMGYTVFWGINGIIRYKLN